MARMSRSLVTLLVLLGLIWALLPVSVSAAPAGAGRARVIVTFKQRPGDAQRAAIRAEGGTVRRTYHLIPAVAAELPVAAVARLAAHPLVARVERDARLTAFDHTPDTGDAELENSWGVEHTGAGTVHAAPGGQTGAGITVAVIDTGVDCGHPDLDANCVAGHDFVNGDDDPFDDFGHGTHVAGIIAAEMGNSAETGARYAGHAGVVGVAPGAQIMPLKILNAAGEGEYSDLIAAIEYAVDHDADVINLSLGGNEDTVALHDAVIAARDAGLVLAAAAGNINPLDFWELFFGCAVKFPAAYPETIAVTFTGENDQLTGYSCTGPQVDLGAPGDFVLSSVPLVGVLSSPNGYTEASGTSMAAPHVAGAVALLLEHGIADTNGNGWLGDEIQGHLCDTASDATYPPVSDSRYPNWYGCGLLDVDRALLLEPPPTESNAAPVANDDSGTTLEDVSFEINVLANDSDADGDEVDITAFTDPAHGTVTGGFNLGGLRYTPDADYFGADSFDYTITDGKGGFDTATVSVTVSAVNDAPTAGNRLLTVAEDGSGLVTLVGSDPDPEGCDLVFSIVSGPAHGSLGQITDAGCSPNGDLARIPYAPAPDYNGPDSFTYRVSDGTVASAPATVSVTVTPVNDVPSASSASASTPAGTPVSIGLAGTDVETCELTFSIVDLPASGSVGPLTGASCVAGSPNADSATISYTPAAGFSGTDSFTYRVSDGTAGSAEATVTVSVSPPAAQLHVGDIDGSTSVVRQSWTATATISVHLGSHSPLSGVVVTGSWSGAWSGVTSCTTGADGRCQVSSRQVTLKKASLTFTVTSLSRAGYTYAAAANHDPDGDSTGTSITILRP